MYLENNLNSILILQNIPLKFLEELYEEGQEKSNLDELYEERFALKFQDELYEEG